MVQASTVSIAEFWTKRSEIWTNTPYWAGPELYEVAPQVTTEGLVPSVIAATPTAEPVIADATGDPGAMFACPIIEPVAPKTEPPPDKPVGPPVVAIDTFIWIGIWLVCGKTIRSYPLGASRLFPNLAY